MSLFKIYKINEPYYLHPTPQEKTQQKNKKQTEMKFSYKGSSLFTRWKLSSH